VCVCVCVCVVVAMAPADTNPGISIYINILCVRACACACARACACACVCVIFINFIFSIKLIKFFISYLTVFLVGFVVRGTNFESAFFLRPLFFLVFCGCLRFLVHVCVFVCVCVCVCVYAHTCRWDRSAGSYAPYFQVYIYINISTVFSYHTCAGLAAKFSTTSDF